jgi:hypothetical protein
MGSPFARIFDSVSAEDPSGPSRAFVTGERHHDRIVSTTR